MFTIPMSLKAFPVRIANLTLRITSCSRMLQTIFDKF
jgi:hypothetical protein